MNDTVVIPNGGGTPDPTPTPDGSPPGHLDKMLNMGDKPTELPGGGTVVERPADVPEKFWDAEKGVINTEALLKSQADAEAALRGQQQAPADDAAAAAAKAAADAAAAAPAAGQDVVNAASLEWQEKGELSEETFASLEKAGLSRDMVNEYIAGQTAIVGNLQAAAYAPFEGKDGYEEAANWAAESLDENEIKALDVQLTSSNPAIVAQGAKALLARFEQDGDHEPSTIRGNANNAAHGGVYTSSREMMKDMNSSKYKTDAKFREEVAAKLSRSNI